MSIVNITKRIFRNKPTVYSRLSSAYGFLKAGKESLFSLLFRVFPIYKNKIVIDNFHGKGYGDNGKYIVEALLKYRQDLDIVWIVRNEYIKSSSFPSGIRTVSYTSIRALFELSTARLWINNCRIKKNIIKRRGQFYIQTWHGGLGLKKIEADTATKLSNKYIRYAKRDSTMADLFISNSKHLTDIYRRAFWYKGDILECGYPKNDILFTDKIRFKESVKKHFGINDNNNILLYAPTFRQAHDVSAYDIDFVHLLDALNDNEKNWVVMVRLHPNVDRELFYKIFPVEVIDATSFPDMQELIMGVDSLITDYSSCMFDSALASIPTFIYASDISKYLDDRGFYFSFNQLPFCVAKNTHELIENLQSFDQSQYISKLEEFYKKVGLYDKGTASQHVAEVVNLVI